MARVAIVTGGTRGIGEAISLALRDEGVTVAAVYAGNDEKAREFTERTGIKFEGAGTLPDRPITATFTRAPLMQVLDVLGAAAELQWTFDSEAVVYWRKNPPVSRPTCSGTSSTWADTRVQPSPASTPEGSIIRNVPRK